MFTIRKFHIMLSTCALLLSLGAAIAEAGFPCRNGSGQNSACFGGRSWNKPAFPPYDLPFPLGQVSDAFHEIQQTNAEAADFILYDYEFAVGEEVILTPKGREHMTQIARRLPHVPFPIVIEMTEKTNDVKENQRLARVDEKRRENVVNWLQKFYEEDPTVTPEEIAGRVVIAPDFEYQVRAERAIDSFNYSESYGNYGGQGGSFGGRGFSR
ncbi:MAG: hypothetical protein E7028_02045 [Planctomycetaceae bacterium]|nr:hypothetical protein [Planctomycetaceae bacterium]